MLILGKREIKNKDLAPYLIIRIKYTQKTVKGNE